MSSHHGNNPAEQERRQIVGRLPVVPVALLGVAALVLAYFLARGSAEGVRRFWFAYVVGYAFVLSLSLGGLFFTLLHHLTRAGWSVAVRRPAELLAGNFALLAVLFIPVLGTVWSGQGTLYRWAQPVPAESHGTPGTTQPAEHAGATHDPGYALAAAEAGHEAGHADGHGHGTGLDALTLKKRAYLNPTFFTLRWVVYFAVWIGLFGYFWRRSVVLDRMEAPELSAGMQMVSAPGLLAFGITLTGASFDLLMSLDPHWFSTIFGVYYFSGTAVAFFAVMSLILLGLQRGGLLTRSVTPEHFHDLGKYLFAFTFFWGYIAFSQYMLYWYANIPEETAWMIRRGMALHAPNAFSPVILALLFGHFVIPFLGLLSRHVKRHRAGLAFWAVWMLLMHWLDLYWLVMPELGAGRLTWSVELLCLVGLAALFAAGWLARAPRQSLLPAHDPRLPESLAFHNV